jgi:ABC-type methionine transport system ATPase subunit
LDPARAHGLVVMTTPLHGVDHRFKSGWAHFSDPIPAGEAHGAGKAIEARRKQTRLRILDYIKRVNEEGTTIFLTTHYMDEADMLSDRIEIMDHGKVIISGTSESLKNTLGKDMIRFETDDDEFSARLSELLNDSRLRIKMVEGSNQLAAEHDIKRTAQMLKELYESLVAGGALA